MQSLGTLTREKVLPIPLSSSNHKYSSVYPCPDAESDQSSLPIRAHIQWQGLRQSTMPTRCTRSRAALTPWEMTTEITKPRHVPEPIAPRKQRFLRHPGHARRAQSCHLGRMRGKRSRVENAQPFEVHVFASFARSGLWIMSGGSDCPRGMNVDASCTLNAEDERFSS